MSSGESTSAEAEAVNTAYLECAEDLRAFLNGVLRNPDLASEALQATWLQAVQAAGQSRSGSRRGWLFRIAWNESLRIRRRKRIDSRAMQKLAHGSPEADFHTAEPARALNQAETITAVRAALSQLPAEQREVVRLRMYENRTFAEIAEQTGHPLGTVLTRMRLALKKLAAALPDENPAQTR